MDAPDQPGAAPAPRLEDVAAAYRSARRAARRRPTWRLRYQARRWRKAAAGNTLDDLDQARLAALRNELRARAQSALPTCRGLP